MWNTQGYLVATRFAETQETAHLTGVDKEDAECIHSIAFSPDGKYIASGNRHGILQLWNWQNNSVDVSFHAHDDGVWSVVYSPDGQFIVSGGGDGSLGMWDQKGNFINHCQAEDSVNCVAFSPDGHYIASGGAEGTLQLWNQHGNPIGQPFQGHQDSISCVVLAQTANILSVVLRTVQ